MEKFDLIFPTDTFQWFVVDIRGNKRNTYGPPHRVDVISYIKSIDEMFSNEHYGVKSRLVLTTYYTQVDYVGIGDSASEGVVIKAVQDSKVIPVSSYIVKYNFDVAVALQKLKLFMMDYVT